MKHNGGCHCGRVRFELESPSRIRVTDCNCSICSMSGYLHLIIPREQFRLVQGEEFLETYQFNTGTAKHHFCKVCGIKAFYIPRSHPDGVSVNARCIDPGTIKSMEIHQLNGKEWEKQYPDGRGTYSDSEQVIT